MGPAKASLYLLTIAFAFFGAGVFPTFGRLSGLLCSMSINYEKDASRDLSASEFSKHASRKFGRGDLDDIDSLSIAPGELPGYTGWARPERTLAGQFLVASALPVPPVGAGEEWYVDVRCAERECRRGGSHFYLRAYGPSVIAGAAEDRGDGSYRMSFYPVDPGRYTVEVVLAFSRAPPFEDFPLVGEREPGYEGYLLPGFPLQMEVAKPPAAPLTKSPILRRLGGSDTGMVPASPRPWCSFDQLVEADDSNAALRTGRWRVVDKVGSGKHRLATTDPNDVSLGDYQRSFNSLGIVMNYVPNDCDLLPQLLIRSSESGRHILDQCLSDVGLAESNKPADHIHVIFIGDSVMRLQVEAFQNFMSGSRASNVRVSKISMFGGISRTLNNVTSALREIYKENPKERRFVVFNSALHDVDRLCSSEMLDSRKRHLPHITDTDLVCVQFYEELLQSLITVIVDFPAELKVFRSTNAAWPKYGNYGFAWPTTKLQPFSRSPNFVARINDIVYDAVSRWGQGEVYIVDGYWITLPRPDHTEVAKIDTIGKHMVHPGLHVINAMTMKLFMLTLHQICSSTLENWN